MAKIGKGNWHEQQAVLKVMWTGLFLYSTVKFFQRIFELVKTHDVSFIGTLIILPLLILS